MALCQHRHNAAFLLRLAHGSSVQTSPLPKESAACRTDTSQGDQKAEGHSEEREPQAVRAALGLEDSPRRAHRRQEQRKALRGEPRLLPRGLYACRRHWSRRQLTALTGPGQRDGRRPHSAPQHTGSIADPHLRRDAGSGRHWAAGPETEVGGRGGRPCWRRGCCCCWRRGWGRGQRGACCGRSCCCGLCPWGTWPLFSSSARAGTPTCSTGKVGRRGDVGDAGVTSRGRACDVARAVVTSRGVEGRVAPRTDKGGEATRC